MKINKRFINMVIAIERDSRDLSPEIINNLVETLASLPADAKEAIVDNNFIVRELAEDSYQVIGNNFIYEVAEAAGLEKVWCIVADNSEITAKLSRILAREEIPRINLSKSSTEEIKSALEYLVQQPNSPLKKINILKATNRIDEAPRQYWRDLKPITKLQCGITAGKKLKVLEQVFYLTPESMPDDIKYLKILNTLTTSELKKIAKKRKLSGYTKFNKNKLIDLLSQ